MTAFAGKEAHIRIAWPDGARFAFTVVDDTDRMTLADGPIVYRFLEDLGFRTTKTVWPIESAAPAEIGGASCQDPEYLAWVLRLQEAGFEVALHGVAAGTADRRETIRGLETFREMFGTDPAILANHGGCRNAIYWGDKRLSGANRFAYNLLTCFRSRDWHGDDETSPLFWGDLCRTHITYVRNFVYGDINTLRACPQMPYHDPDRPYVDLWFASSEGATVRSYVTTLSEEAQERLEAEGGACIMYTHFAAGFVEDGRLHPEFRRLMERLAGRPGWFAPAAAVLNHLRAAGPGDRTITPRERSALERAWLRHKLRTRGTT